MERENYYILLNLSIDPPEMDPGVIEAAILQKKAEWSRLRNHPTKGLQAQKFINMIPDIEQVMRDDALRQQEAADAVETIEKGKEAKLSEIESHIDILMGKGFIADEDIARLADTHGVDKGEIQGIIAAKKNAHYIRVDQQINLRMGKGYLTEAELSKIAKQNGMEISELRSRVHCPIVKDEKEAGEIKSRPLEKAIEKAINDNLNIIGKSSLYDFLGALENSELETLQEKASKKKKDISLSAKKDAMVTASNILVGHCLTIFKTNETRIAYDVSLATAKLASLESDINIAAANNRIRHEYVDILINKAMQFGMDRQEAIDYLREYCQKKKYRLESKPEIKQKLVLVAGAAVLAAVVLIVGGVIFISTYQTSSLKTEYKKLLTTIDAQNAPEAKIAILEQYIKSHEPGEWVTDAESRVNKLKQVLVAGRLNRFLKEADALVQAGEYKKALALYNGQLASSTDAGSKKILTDLIQKTLALSEQKDFEAVSAISLKGEPDQKMALYRKYLADHPDGKNKNQVNALINEMSGEYFIYVTKQVEAYNQAEKWEDSYQLCKQYTEIYDNSNSDRIKQLLPDLEEKIRGEKIFAGLVEKAAAKGTDYAAALEIFKEYLEAYPDTTISTKIQKEIDRFNELITAQAAEKAAQDLRAQLAKTGGRFVERTAGAVVDTRTGLMWQLMDSAAIEGKECLTYDEGKDYVKNLKTGGFSNWRLPTPAELTGLHEGSPAFSAIGPKTYWTSENYTGYADGWHVMVDTLTTADGVHWGIEKKDSMECGAVRAVRNP